MPLPIVAAVLLAASPPPPAGACALVPPETVASAQGARVVSRKESRSRGSVVERRDCFYEADPFARSVSLEWIVDARPGGARERWNSVFHESGRDEEKREREEERERPKTPPAPVAGLGDEAFWAANPASGALYVLAGNSFVRVSVGGPGTSEAKRDRARVIAARAVASIRGAAPEGKKKTDGSAPAKTGREGAI